MLRRGRRGDRPRSRITRGHVGTTTSSGEGTAAAASRSAARELLAHNQHGYSDSTDVRAGQHRCWTRHSFCENHRDDDSAPKRGRGPAGRFRAFAASQNKAAPSNDDGRSETGLVVIRSSRLFPVPPQGRLLYVAVSRELYSASSREGDMLAIFVRDEIRSSQY